jgi:hypothetical protein
MILILLFGCLVIFTVVALVKRRMLKLVLVAWIGYAVFAAGTCMVALDTWNADTTIKECRAPLVGDFECAGFNDSWTECKWAFRAEGRPERALCERFLRLPRGYRSDAETRDYDDVRSFSEVDCDDWSLSKVSRCFEGARHEHEATNRYLLAFNSDCRAAVVLRACNQGLDVAARQHEPEHAKGGAFR